MELRIDIPDELVPVVSAILNQQSFDYGEFDDGITDCIIMRKTGVSVKEFVQAQNIVDNLKGTISEAARGLE